FARATGARRERLHALDRLRETMGYRATLARGYAVVRAEGQLVTTAAQAAEAGLLEIEFADARLAALPSATTASAAPRGRKSA
ncbi:MAG TPA: exodeoxyribonuclease VII large subunit, partial [Rhodobacteraceae bacterium]|nr:exodeoxyribonuclease VII large subunit [Paracoccaceae bacterium]